MIPKRGDRPKNGSLIVARNCEDLIETLLRGIDSQKQVLDELVIVDVGSADDTRKKIADFFGMWASERDSKTEAVVWSRDEIRLHEGGGIDFVRVHPLTNMGKDLSTPYLRLVLRRWRWWKRIFFWGGPRQYAKSLVSATGFINVAIVDGNPGSIGGKK